MPVRVRCRCGQELVLRYGEWVYFFLGLALLCLVVNMLALLLLYLRLEDISRSRENSALPASAITGGGGKPSLELPAPASNGGLPREAAPALGPGKSAVPEPPPSPKAPSEPKPSGTKATTEREGDGAGRAPLKAGAAPSEGGPAPQPLVSLDSVAGAFLPPGASPRSLAPQEATALVAKKPAGWVDEPPLLRLFLLESAAGSDLFAHAFLSDPDPRLRALALKKARSLSDDSSRDRAATRRLIEAAWEFLRGDPDGRRLLAASGVQGPAESAPERSGRAEPFLESLRDRLEEASARALSEASPRALKAFLARHEEQGTELVLLVDSSESMKQPLKALQAQAGWLFPALSWAMPGIRVGAVIYRDGVEQATGFSTGSMSGVVAAIRQARPEGGGDVPEGVHLALQAALELGRFDWRPASSKIIVVLGDAPPPYSEVPGLLSLASRALRQGGYHVHALGFEPEEGRKAVQFFPELARSGGGRAVTVESLDDVALEVLRCVFPGETLAAVEFLVPDFRTLASLGGG
jgi:Mg-chelatase subunit ChlD